MRVMKFGGSSLADGLQVAKVAGIIEARQNTEPVVVLSAHKGITDLLVTAAKQAANGRPDAGPVIDRQTRIADEVGAEPAMLEPFFAELTDLLKGISLVREVSPRLLDLVQSFGERMSVRTVAAHLRSRGIQAEAFDAFDLGFITDARFGAARPLPGLEKRARAAYRERVTPGVIPVITGFVGKTESGEITTVGRNGSDYTASCFAAALNAEECQIWTDTDGVMTSDPHLVDSARGIPTMSFAEASELAHHGGRVLHPSTLLPAVERQIPVRVLNTDRPDYPGTVITPSGGEPIGPITSIAYKKEQCVITIASTRMLGQPGFLARVFAVFGTCEVNVDAVSTSEVTVSITCAYDDNLSEVIARLQEHGRVTITRNKSLVCVVGRAVRTEPGIAARAFGALAEAGINVEMISHGANNTNLSLVVDDTCLTGAVTALHRRFF